MQSIVSWCVHRRGAVAVFALALLILGGWRAGRVPLDVFPEFVPVQVEIQTEAPGLSPEQLSQLRLELEQLREFRRLAASIVKNSKGEVLLTALRRGFALARGRVRRRSPIAALQALVSSHERPAAFRGP